MIWSYRFLMISKKYCEFDSSLFSLVVLYTLCFSLTKVLCRVSVTIQRQNALKNILQSNYKLKVNNLVYCTLFIYS